ncbi:hypothetical protein LXA43DRAFT_1008493 [Ganoderma leucocontextum]|nr:hypothetical protein LXA43DRAFT_1008493 [Ganoderma leucocontextum]
MTSVGHWGYILTTARAARLCTSGPTRSHPSLRMKGSIPCGIAALSYHVLFTTRQVQLLLVHHRLRLFPAKLQARPRFPVRRPMEVLIITDDLPRLRREPLVEWLLLARLPVIPGVCTAAGGQEEILEGRHRIDEPGRGGLQVDFALHVHRVSFRKDIRHVLVDGVVEDDVEVREGGIESTTRSWNGLVVIARPSHTQSITGRSCFLSHPAQTCSALSRSRTGSSRPRAFCAASLPNSVPLNLSCLAFPKVSTPSPVYLTNRLASLAFSSSVPAPVPRWWGSVPVEYGGRGARSRLSMDVVGRLPSYGP